MDEAAPTGEALTERLLDAAAEVFAERGYERAGVAEIARRAGVTTGAIYSRYSGKAELLLDAVDRRMDADLEYLLSGGTGEEPAVELLATIGSHLVDEIPDGMHLFLEAVVASRRDHELGERLRHRLMDEDARLGKIVDEAKADGVFDTTLSTRAVVRLAHSIGIGMTVARSLGLPMPTETNWSAIVDRLIVAAGHTTQQERPGKPNDHQ